MPMASTTPFHFSTRIRLVPSLTSLWCPRCRCWCLRRQRKKSASSRRRGGKEKSGGGHESSSSRRRRGSKSSRDAPDDDPMTAGGNTEGWDRSSASSNLNLKPSGLGDVNIEPEDKDDSYLFMGATAVGRQAQTTSSS